MNWLDYDLIYGIALACIHSLWQGVLILGLVSVILRLASPAKPHLNYWIYLGGLAAMMLAWVLTFLYFQMPSSQTLSLELTDHLRYLSNEHSSKGFLNNYLLYRLLAFGWILGSFFFLLKVLWGSHEIYHIRKNSIPAKRAWQEKVSNLSAHLQITGKVYLQHSAQITIPMVVGFIKPVILMPSFYFNQLSAQHLEAVLIHELIHIKRHDYLINLMQVLMESLLFYHPVTWVFGRKIRQYREYICDDQVQKAVNLSSYLEALYQIANFSSQNIQLTTALYHHKNELIMRVKRMLNRPFVDIHVKPIIYVLLVLLIAFSQYAFRQVVNKVEVGENTLQPLGEVLLNSIQVQSENLNITMDLPLLPQEDLAESSEQVVKPQLVRSIDTIPNPQKIKELEQKIAEKSRELEDLTGRISKEVEQKMEAKIKELEAQSAKLEAQLEPRIKEMEEAFKSEEHEKVLQFEKRQQELETRMKMSMGKLEERMESQEFKDLEQQMEQKAKQLELIESQPQNEDQKETSQKLQKEIQVIHMKMQKQMHEFQEAHHKIMNDPEMKKLQIEMQEHSQIVHEIHQKHQQIWNDEAKELQHQLSKIHHQIQQEMHTINHELHQEIQFKSQELQQLHYELERIKRSMKNR